MQQLTTYHTTLSISHKGVRGENFSFFKLCHIFQTYDYDESGRPSC